MPKGTPMDERVWLSASSEFLNAVRTLSFESIPIHQSAKMNAPVRVLLAYAFEQLLKVESKIRLGCFQETHDLMTLWEIARPALGSIVARCTTDYKTAMLSQVDPIVGVMDPEFGSSNESFEANFEQLNLLTMRPFQSRYPKIAVFDRVDIRFLHFIGRAIHFHLEAKL
jgi:hypothetical protein